MLDFNAPNGYKVRCYAGDTVYVSHPNDDRIVACYTPRHGDTVYPDLYPTMVEGREALAYGKQWLRDQVSDQQDGQI